MIKKSQNFGYPEIFFTAVPKPLEPIAQNFACIFPVAMGYYMPNFSHLWFLQPRFWPENMAKNGQKTSKYVFLAIYAYIVLAGTSKFAWMFLVVRCTYAENLKWLPLLFLGLSNFEFFQNFKIAYFSYKTWIFGHNVDAFTPNLTIIILVTYIWSTDFFKVMDWSNHPKKWLQIWQKSTKNDKF